MMLGAELTKLDDWTLSLLTNKKVLRLLTHSSGARQVMRNKEQAIWFSKDTEKDVYYLALFNLSDDERNVSISPEELYMESFDGYDLEELWTNESKKADKQQIEAKIIGHGAKLYAMTK